MAQVDFLFYFIFIYSIFFSPLNRYSRRALPTAVEAGRSALSVRTEGGKSVSHFLYVRARACLLASSRPIHWRSPP